MTIARVFPAAGFSHRMLAQGPCLSGFTSEKDHRGACPESIHGRLAVGRLGWSTGCL